MSRQLLDEALMHPAISSRIAGRYRETIDEVASVAAGNSVVVVGMALNPFCKKIRKRLDREQVAYVYLEYGSYFKDWSRRLALKMWSGWPTFPMVFVGGQLVGGCQETCALLASGELKNMLDKTKS